MSDINRPVQSEAVIISETVRSRVSWPAVFAGVILAFMVMAILNMLAVGVGISSVDLRADADSNAGIGTGLGWSMIIINLVAYALGGYITGRLARPNRGGRGFLHGLLTWAVMVLASAWLLTSAAGAVLGSIGSVIGSGLDLAAQGIGALAPALSEGVDNATSDLTVTSASIQDQLSDLLRESAEDGDTSPALAGIQVQQLVRDVFSGDDELFSADNRTALVDLMVDQTDLSSAEAEDVVASWEASYLQAQQQVDELKAELTEVAEEAQAALTRTMLWGAVALLVAAAVAGWMGGIGASTPETDRTGVAVSQS